MAAIDLRGVFVYPYYRKITVGTTAQEIILPDSVDQIEIANWHSSNDLYVGQNDQTDGATWGTDAQFPIPAKQAKAIPLGRGPARASSMFIAASTGTIDAYIEISDK
jgi:hypothetical protein